MTDTELHRIEIQSIVSAETGEAFVQIRGAEGQLTPAQARGVGLDLLVAAEAAETDALILRFSENALGDKRYAALILQELRAMRGEAPRQDWRTDEP